MKVLDLTQDNIPKERRDEFEGFIKPRTTPYREGINLLYDIKQIKEIKERQ